MNKAAAELSLANDFIFGEVMRQPENVKPLLEAVLEKKIAEITYIEKQQDIKDGFELHGIRLDISLEDSDKTQYAVEMQTGSAYDLERRIRYYQSSLDRRTLEVSEHYRDLKSSYVIFVCTDDYYKRGLALYRRKSVIEGAEDIVYDDGSHAYILNAQFTQPNINESAQEFLRYINAKKNKLSFDVSGNEYLTRIDRAVEDIKSDDRKVERFMTLAAKLEDVRFIALREGEEKGRTEAMVGLVKRLLKQQRSMEDISNICGLDLDEVKKIAEEG